MNIQKLLGLEYEPDLVDLMFSEKSEAEIKRIFLLGLIKESELKLTKLEDAKTATNSKASIDEERAELINGVKSLFSDKGMTIINWIAIARQIEDILETEGEKQGKDLLPNGKRYFPKDISERRLENSVCAGWKKLEA